MPFVKLADVADVPENSVRGVVHGDLEIAIYSCNGAYYATSNVCTHAYAQLSEGWFEPEDCTIECPLHGAKFSIESGAVLALPAYKPVATYDIRVEDGAILVDVPS